VRRIRFFLAVMLIAAVPLHGIAATSTLLCMAMPHGDAPHDDHHDKKASPCGPCASCCVPAIAASVLLPLPSSVPSSPPRFTATAATSFALDTPERPPLAA